MLDRLMCRTVLTETDGVVREHVDDTLLHQRGHPQRVAAVVGKRQEGADERDESAVQRNAVGDRAHAELAHAVADVASRHEAGTAILAIARAQLRRLAPAREVAAGQIGRAAEHLGYRLAQHLERQLRGLAGGHRLALGKCGRHRSGHHRIEAGRQFTAQPARQFGRLLREARGVGVEAGAPVGLEHGAPGARIPAGVDRGRNVEWRMRPADGGTCQRDLGVAQRFAMRLLGAGAVRRSLADHRATDDQRRRIGRLRRLRDGGLDRRDIMAVDRADHVPAVGAEARRGVVGEPVVHLAVDRDAVVVVQRHQLAELPDAGQRGHLVRDAFHQAAVAEEHPGAVVDHVVAGAVEFGSEQLFRKRHANRIGEALAERTRGRFHARRDADLRMPRRLAVHLTEVDQLLHREVITRQVQQRVVQHRAVTVADDEAIAVGPLRIGRVVPVVPAPQRQRDLGHAHGHARMTGVGLLHRIHRQGPDGVAQIAVGGGEGGAGSRHVGREAIARGAARPVLEESADFTGVPTPGCGDASQFALNYPVRCSVPEPGSNGPARRFRCVCEGASR